MRALLLIIVFACDGKPADPAPLSYVSTAPPADAAPKKTEHHRVLVELAGFRDEICKCAAGDRKCAIRAYEKMMRWGQEEAQRQTPLEVRRSHESGQLGMEIHRCLERGTNPPGAGTGTGSATLR